MPTTCERNDGATAVNNPLTAKPANAAMAAMTNIRAYFVRHRKSLQPICARARGEVSGTTRIAAAASTTSAMCTMNVKCSGDGAYSTSTPASSGPAPRPPMLATVRHRGRAAPPFRRRRLDDGRRRCAGEKARGQTRQHPADQQQRHRVGGQEHHGAGQGRHQPCRKHRPPAHRVGPPAERQQREQHPAGVGGVDHGGGQAPRSACVRRRARIAASAAWCRA